MKNLAAAVAGLAIVLAVAGCSTTPQAADTSTSAAKKVERPTPSATTTPLPVTVIVPDASDDIGAEVAKMGELGLDAVVLDADGDDVTYQYDMDYDSAAVFVSQDPAAGTEVEDGATITVKVRDPKVVVSADFSGAGGSITTLEGTSISQVTDAPQHWEKEVPYGDTTDYTFTNPYAAGTLTCTVTQEGEVVQTNTASGPFASTNC